MNWQQWLDAHAPELAQGRGVAVAPAENLPHPAAAGFRRLTLAEPWGQMADWAASLDDGSRLHVHEMKDGALIAHVDQHDPARGPGVAVYHWGTESASGRATLFTTCFWLLIKLAPFAR